MSRYEKIGEISGTRKDSKAIIVDWIINDFFSLSSSHYESHHFHFSDEVWCLRLTTFAQTSGEVNLHLYRMSSGPRKSINLMFGIKYFNGELRQDRMKHVFENDNLVCSRNFCSRSDLWKMITSANIVIFYCNMETDASSSANVLSYKDVSSQTNSEMNKLVAATDMNQFMEKPHLSIDPARSEDKCVQVSLEVAPDIEALSSDISSLLEEEILPDFVLKCGGRSFQVHRSVLAARSEVLRAMLKNGMQESETGSADISDLEAPVLESLLKILYSGKLGELSEGTATSLYAAADKYAVHSLRRSCSRFMISNMTEENCIFYLYTADSRSDPDLKAAAVSFILAHSGIFKSTSWLAFLEEHPVLASEVLQTYVASTIE